MTNSEQMALLADINAQLQAVAEQRRRQENAEGMQRISPLHQLTEGEDLVLYDEE